MINTVYIGTLTFLIIAPALSICDEDLSKATSSRQGSGDQEPQHPSPPENLQRFEEPWPIYRNLRAPSGFFGVRGKKLYDEFNDEDLSDVYFEPEQKRAPSQAFFGMRGKKLFGYKRTPSGFYGMRGKRYMFEDETNDNDLQAELYRDLMLERNNIADLLEEDHKSEKRLPSGFIGSRGKKSVNNDDYYEFEKRAPMGFQGVRGKKSEFPNYIQTEDKRAPLAGFFGMRGKKQPIAFRQSSFFGVRKKPFMTYGKFVGVRGKKGDESLAKRLTLDASDLISELQPAQRVPADSTQDKRIGFIGMRG